MNWTSKGDQNPDPRKWEHEAIWAQREGLRNPSVMCSENLLSMGYVPH